MLRWKRYKGELGNCLAIPYRDQEGKPVAYVRLKPDNPRKSKPEEGSKPIKYESPKGASNRAYFPPGTLAALTDATAPLVITEGEKKAAKADQEGFACLGLVGVYGWQKKHLKDKDGKPQGERKLIDDLAAIPWQGRTVYVCFDSDAVTNPGVRWAEWHLAETLLRQGALVKVVRLPQGKPGPNGKPAKIGLDDFLVAHGPDAFVELLTTAHLPDLPDLPDAALQKSEWGPPLLLGSPPNVPPFPVAVFPEPLQQFIHEAAAALPCPPDYLAVPLLVTAGGMIGASRALAIKAKHIQRAALYAAVVGGPGTAKTPSLEAVVDPVHDIEEEAHAKWELAMAQYEADLEDYEQRKKEARKNNEELPQKPVKPLLLRLTVDDATAEAMAPILKENPRGVVMIADELIGWVQRMNAYREGGKGADRQFWLSAWSGKTATIDRKKSHELGPIRIHKPFVGVVGGLVPDNLTTLRGDQHRQRGKNDGFLDRLLLSYPVELPATEENWADISEETSQRLAAVYAQLRTLQMVPIQEGEVVRAWRPFLVNLAHEGKTVWQQFTRQHAAERNADDFPPYLIGPWSKFRGYCGRLALVIHFLRWACGDIESDTADVDGESLTPCRPPDRLLQGSRPQGVCRHRRRSASRRRAQAAGLDHSRRTDGIQTLGGA